MERMETHRLLTRILDKSGLSKDSLPDDPEKWGLFLGYINKAFKEAEQERYLMERSMNISSQEMIDINNRLEQAQQIAGLCYWSYGPMQGPMYWSRGLYTLLEMGPLDAAPSFESFFKAVHPEDKQSLKRLFKKALIEETNAGIEIRIKIQGKDYKWFKVIRKKHADIADKGHVSGILMDISKAKESEKKINELNKTFLTTARLIGMSEVAISILHNVGNILNSANVSTELIKRNANSEHYKKLLAIVSLMEENIPHLSQYLVEDKKGKLILPCITGIAKVMKKEHQTNLEEALRLEKNLDHIKKIIATH